VPKQGHPILGRLVDDFPYYQAGLPPRFLDADAEFTLLMRRDASCDIPAEYMFFPGHLHVSDLVARDHSGSQVVGSNTLSNTSSLPCFSALHKTWKYAGHQREADWWY
jgi:hypothetical protein